MSNTLDLIKKAYAMGAADVAHDESVQLPVWEQLPPGYGAAFIHMFTAGRWNNEKMEYELKAQPTDQP